MHSALTVIIALLAVLVAVTVAAPRLRLPQPILLVLAGLGLSQVPGLPRVPLDPELVLLLFLPPLLYSDAFHSSWRDFRRWLRPILMLAIGLVAATTLAVGLVAHAFFPDLPWAVCFALGAIVSPTDTVAAHAVLERLRVPRRLAAILGGESLVNDATGLVGVQIAVAVTMSGLFSAGEIAATFAWVAGGGVAIGLGTGLVFAALNRWLSGTQVLFAVSLLSPYLATWIAVELHASAVLAVVVAGFLVSWRMHHVPAASRVGLYQAWDLVTFLLNGVSFVFIGLEAPGLLRGLPDAGWALAAALAVAATVIVTRIAWMFPAAYLPLMLSRRLRAIEGGAPPWQGVTVCAWAGMRGVVSLAAALALPRASADGTPFPGRDVVVFATVVVIAATLLVQGATLAPLIRWLGLTASGDDGEAEVRAAREAVLGAGIARLDAFCSEVACPIAVHHLRTAMVDRLASLRDEDAAERDLAHQRLQVSRDVRSAVRAAQAAELLRLRDDGRIDDKAYAELQLELDRAGLDDG
ncbi:MAG TPA: Na+/H+ antiporter [Planctomycetota bacterium]|nr:Na+/H+ antiporter [Planctomycetota bacterium]